MTAERQQLLQDALKRAGSALNASDVRFALGGSYALWVYGAPESQNDVDLVVAEDDAESAAKVLAAAGFDIERTPEEWLFKARPEGHDDVVVDVLHRLNGRRITGDELAGAETRDVLGVHVPVLPVQQVVTVRLLSFSEHYCDFASVLPSVRAVREQLDWPRLRADTEGNDFAAAFLYLTRRLGISPE